MGTFLGAVAAALSLLLQVATADQWTVALFTGYKIKGMRHCDFGDDDFVAMSGNLVVFRQIICDSPQVRPPHAAEKTFQLTA